MKTVNATKVLTDTVMMKEKLPETYNRLFKFKKFNTFEKKVRLKHNEIYEINPHFTMINPWRNIEILMLLPEPKSFPLILACSLN